MLRKANTLGLPEHLRILDICSFECIALIFQRFAILLWSICSQFQGGFHKGIGEYRQMILSGRALEGETSDQTEYCMLVLTQHHRECSGEGCSTYSIKVVKESDESWCKAVSC